jgi:hypothetical protein
MGVPPVNMRLCTHLPPGCRTAETANPSLEAAVPSTCGLSMPAARLPAITITVADISKIVKSYFSVFLSNN